MFQCPKVSLQDHTLYSPEHVDHAVLRQKIEAPNGEVGLSYLHTYL